MTERHYTVIAHYRRPAGRSAVLIRCPWCGTDTEARVWSLAGRGKRCECGALFTGPVGTANAVAEL